MIAENPEVAWLGDRFVGDGWDVIRVRQAVRAGEGVEELLEVAVIEAEEVEVGALFLQRGEEVGEVVLFPLSLLGVVAQRAFLREDFGDVHEDRWDRLPAEVLGGAEAHIPCEDRAVRSCQDWAQLEKAGSASSERQRFWKRSSLMLRGFRGAGVRAKSATCSTSG